MGIQINGQTDTITATDGALTVSGADLPTVTNLNATGVVTATSFSGPITGNVTGNVNATGLSTFSGGIQVGATTSIVVGSSFVRNNAVGLGTTSTTGRNAGVGTATGTIIYNSTTNAIEAYDGNSWFTVKASISASGGTVTSAGITPGNGYRYHVFTSPGTFTVNSGAATAEYLVVAGGGGGGTGTGGGGGAGGVRYGTTPVVTGSYSITVGAAGTARVHGTASDNGNPSTFGPIVSQGGGKGASGSNGGTINVAFHGGSGGGGGFYPSTYMPGATTGGTGNSLVGPVSSPSTPSNTGQGNPGGNQPTGSDGGSGGGGAGGSGTSGTGPNSSGTGLGGPGIPYPAFAAPLISPEIPTPAQPTWIPAVGPTGLYGGGGGGAGSPIGGAGGPGGGGLGSPGGGAGVPGVNYTGGGAGANWSYGPTTGGAGGAGIVIIRYQV
jgi:hypothetical protein